MKDKIVLVKGLVELSQSAGWISNKIRAFHFPLYLHFLVLPSFVKPNT